jgi:hypothetical protein
MKLIQIMTRILLSSLIILTLFSFCAKSPEAKSIDHVSIPYLEQTELRLLKKYFNDDHLVEAHKSDLKAPIKDKKTFDLQKNKICQKADFEKIGTNELYAVARLTHSLPYLNDQSAEFLEILGERMQESFEEKGISHYRFVLTSVLRTQRHQRLLQRVNANATPKETSHYFGTTFDISQTRFLLNDSKESVYSYRLRNILARELIKLQEEGKCYVILESREKCFHVTVKQ